MAEVECVIITVMVTQPLAFTNRDIYTTSTLHIQHLDTTKSRKSGVEKEHFVLLFCMIWNVITSNVQLACKASVRSRSSLANQFQTNAHAFTSLHASLILSFRLKYPGDGFVMG